MFNFNLINRYQVAKMSHYKAQNVFVQMEQIKNEAIEQRNDHPDTCCQTLKPTTPWYGKDA